MLLPQQSWRNVKLLYRPLKGIARHFIIHKIWIVAVGFLLSCVLWRTMIIMYWIRTEILNIFTTDEIEIRAVITQVTIIKPGVSTCPIWLSLLGMMDYSWRLTNIILWWNLPDECKWHAKGILDIQCINVSVLVK